MASMRATDRRRAAVSSVSGKLNALSPLATLARGYAVARDARGHALGSVAAFAPGQAFALVLRDGQVGATANTVLPGAMPAARGAAG